MTNFKPIAKPLMVFLLVEFVIWRSSNLYYSLKVTEFSRQLVECHTPSIHRSLSRLVSLDMVYLSSTYEWDIVCENKDLFVS